MKFRSRSGVVTVMFLPVRGDGLKYVLVVEFRVETVSPRKGRWIEIDIVTVNSVGSVSPRKGRWIEMTIRICVLPTGCFSP